MAPYFQCNGPGLRLLRQLIATLRDRQKRWADIEALALMSDRDLADIGLRRADIGTVAYQTGDLDTAEWAERSSANRERAITQALSSPALAGKALASCHPEPRSRSASTSSHPAQPCCATRDEVQ